MPARPTQFASAATQSQNILITDLVSFNSSPSRYNHRLLGELTYAIRGVATLSAKPKDMDVNLVKKLEETGLGNVNSRLPRA